MAAPCPWATELATYLDAAIQSGALAGLPVEAGSGWPAGFDGNADALRITTAAEDVLYDFETVVPVDLLSFGVD